MAGDWIKMRHDLRDDPSCLTLSDKLSEATVTTLGRLFLFWAWADRHTANGEIKNVTKSNIDKVVDADGFADAMVTVGWLEETPNGFRLPNYDRHNSSSCKARALESEAKRIRRGNEKTGPKKAIVRKPETNESTVCPTLSDKMSDQRREEESREKNSHTHTPRNQTPLMIPDGLKVPWARWCEFRLAIDGRPIDPIQADAVLMELDRRGQAKAIDDIDFSIRKGAKTILDSDNDFEKQRTARNGSHRRERVVV